MEPNISPTRGIKRPRYWESRKDRASMLEELPAVWSVRLQEAYQRSGGRGVRIRRAEG